jgi:hypothetical protein
MSLAIGARVVLTRIEIDFASSEVDGEPPPIATRSG